ncbi:MAG: hypothetical protein AAGC46_05630 [Solirubrobacteraceae bacterium]|nr:hypothetical protein [Patulibacter sp.]
MGRSSYVEETQIVAQALPEVPRFERVANVLGLSGFAVVLAIGFALWLAKFQVDGSIVQAAFSVVAVGAIVTFVRIRPASSLTPTERMIRSKRWAFLLLGLLTGCAVLGSIATAFSLHTTQDWLMLLFIMSSPIGMFFLINTHFGMG